MESMRETLGSISKDNLSGFESTEWSIAMNPHTSVMCYYSRESCEQGHVLTLPMEGQP
mgnify:FL=1